MIFYIHTLELTLNPSTEKFDRWQNKAFEKAKGSHRVFSDAYKCTGFALANKGVKIKYHDGTYKKKIKLIVNPTKVLGGDDIKSYGSLTMITFQSSFANLKTILLIISSQSTTSMTSV